MTESIQTFLIRRIFPPFTKLNEKIGKRFSDVLFTLSIVCIFLMQYLNHANLMGARFIYMFVPFCIFMGIAILTGLHKDLKPVRFRMPLMLFWCITGLFALVTGVVICHDHLADFIVMMIIMPLFFIVWANQTQRLFPLLTNAVQLAYVILILFNMFFFRVTTNYEGFFINPNRLSMVSAVAFAPSIVRFLHKNTKTPARVISCVISALSAGVILLTESRAGLVVIALSTVFALAVYIITKPEVKVLLCRVLILIFAFACAIFLTEPIFNAAYGFTELVSNPVAVEEAVWERQPQRYTRITFVEDPNPNDNDEPEEYTVELYSKADNTLMNGRKPIWKAYFSALDILGHSTDEPTPYIYNGAEYKAHNTPLQMAYSYGFPAGAAYLVFNILGGIVLLIMSVKRKDDYVLFALIITVAFGAYSMIESLVSPVNQTPTFLYFISLAALVCKPEKTVEKIK